MPKNNKVSWLLGSIVCALVLVLGLALYASHALGVDPKPPQRLDEGLWMQLVTPCTPKAQQQREEPRPIPRGDPKSLRPTSVRM